MNFENIKSVIERVFDNNEDVNPKTSGEVREDAFLFGENPSRIIVSVREVIEDDFLDLISKSNIPFMLLGHVTKGEIRIDDVSFGNIKEYKNIHNNSLKNQIESK